MELCLGHEPAPERRCVRCELEYERRVAPLVAEAVIGVPAVGIGLAVGAWLGIFVGLLVAAITELSGFGPVMGVAAFVGCLIAGGFCGWRANVAIVAHVSRRLFLGERAPPGKLPEARLLPAR
jgi:hypothetical protein